MTDNTAYVLVVDDEPSICWAFDRLLRDEGFDVVSVASAEEAMRTATARTPLFILLDVRLPKASGLEILPELRRITGNAPIVVMTAFGDLPTAVDSMQLGASEYLIKPFTLDEALRVCRNAADVARSAASASAVRFVDKQDCELVGKSAAMQAIFRQIAMVADSELSVLVTGETGTGKELVAAALHRHSRRRNQPYLALAPVSLNPALLESDLFGHVRGAYTGAVNDRRGLFESADGGSVFLDEIGELPADIQVKLLRVLEERMYVRLGESMPTRCDVRLIAATNRELSDAIENGDFREDFLYRLGSVRIHLPPLRDRPEDIPHICRYYLQRMNYPDSDSAIDGDLASELQSRPWRGNVRELKSSLEQAVTFARGRRLRADDFPKPSTASAAPDRDSLADAVASWTRSALCEASEADSLYERLTRTIEPPLFREVMRHTGGNKALAAKLLGIHRGTFRERLRDADA